MFSSKEKLDREKQRHFKCLKEIKEERRDYDQKSSDELNRLRSELLEMKAYKEVYRQHSLKNYYGSEREQSQEETSEETEKSKETPNFVNVVKMRMGHECRNETPIGFLPRQFETHDDGVTVITRKCEDSAGDVATDQDVRHKLTEEAHRNLVMAKLKVLQKEDPFGLRSIFHPEDPTPCPRNSPIPTDIDRNVGFAVAAMTTRVVERRRQEQQRVQEVRQRVFPEKCKNRFSLNRFIEEKKSELYHKWSEPERKKQNKEKLIEKCQFPNIVERRKSTSAIFRDYRMHKSGKRKSSLQEHSFTLPQITTVGEAPIGTPEPRRERTVP